MMPKTKSLHSRIKFGANKAKSMVSEHSIQSYVSIKLKQLGILHHGDMNGVKTSKSQAVKSKLAGACAGWPDMCIVLYNKILFIEFKTLVGKLSENQKEVHKKLHYHGFDVHVVYAGSGEDAWGQTQKLLKL